MCRPVTSATRPDAASGAAHSFWLGDESPQANSSAASSSAAVIFSSIATM